MASCIVTGIGAGIAIASVQGGPDAGAVILICLGLGFLAIWPLSRLFELPDRVAWGVIPGVILAGIGVLQLGSIRRVDLGGWWPLILVGIGIAVILRGSVGRDRR